MKLLGKNISDCVRLYQEGHNRNIVLQQQLDDSNAKLLAQFEVQNAEILKFEDQIKKSQAVSDFYREQAMTAGSWCCTYSPSKPKYLLRRCKLYAGTIVPTIIFGSH